jgi:hypothetical protein
VIAIGGKEAKQAGQSEIHGAAPDSVTAERRLLAAQARESTRGHMTRTRVLRVLKAGTAAGRWRALTAACSAPAQSS